MGKFDFSNLSKNFRVLTYEGVQEIASAVVQILENVGVQVEEENALKVFEKGGAQVNFRKRRVTITESLVKESIKRTPSEVKLHYRNGKKIVSIGGANTNFLPGSSALNILDLETGRTRKPTVEDQADFAKLVDALPNIHVQSGPLIVTDVPLEICDRYRVYPVLKNSVKPIITGAYSIEGLKDMIKMVKIVTGEEASKKPIFSDMCCPSSPLTLGSLVCQSVMECAKEKVPVVVISAPISGATSPATLAGTVVSHACEVLSAIVLGQVVNPRSYFIYGGSPGIMDMRYGNFSMGAIESNMMNCAHVEIGKYFGLPTHAYLGLSDSKIADAQAGIEATTGITLATLTEVNAVSGPGMLEFESCQSFEKIVIDNQICEIAFRLKRGIQVSAETLALDLMKKIGPGGHFLASRHTNEWFKKEQLIPSQVIDRMKRESWEQLGCKDATQRAREIAKKIINEHKPEPLPKEAERKLDSLIRELHGKNI